MGQKSVDIFRHPIPIVHSLASPSRSRTSVCKRVTARQRGIDVESHELRIRKYDAKVIRALNIKGSIAEVINSKRLLPPAIRFHRLLM